MKWMMVLLGVLAVVFIAFSSYWTLIKNPQIVRELQDDPQGTRAGIVMLLTFPDGKRLPVNYLRESDTVYVGADGPWWRAFRDKGAPVSLEIRGQQLSGHAVAILDDKARVDDVFSRLRPTVPQWLPDWMNGKLIVISLES